jgi:hypothetical protein
MNLSSLIQSLQEIEAIYGDLPVYVRDHEWWWDYPMREVYIRTEEADLMRDKVVYPDLPLRVTFTDKPIV